MNNGQLAPEGARSAESLRCPTCGAQQSPALVCRRCRCDLSLLVAVLAQESEQLQQTLRLLRIGRYAQACQIAKRRWRLQPDADATRLLGVCYLLQGDFQAALELCRPERPAARNVVQNDIFPP